MKHTQILKRAWTILWSYKTLWIFGILLALTSAGSGRGSGSNSSGSSRGSSGSGFNLPGDIRNGLQQAYDQFNGVMRTMTPQTEQAIIGIVIGLVCVGILVGLLFTAVHYVSQVALVRMVDHLETTGEKVPFRRGWRMGWSRAAWRVFGINVVIGVPVFLAAIVLMGCALTPVLIPVLSNGEPSIASIVATVGMAFLVIFAIIVVSVVLSLVLEILYRVSILQERGVLDSIREGWTLVRRNFKDVGLMWLILLGIRIAFGVVLIPVVLVLVGAGLLLGGATGLGLFFATRAMVNVTAGWVTALLAGIPIFILTLAVPLTFVEGLRQTYFSTTWTLAYRELRPGLELAGSVTAEPEPGLPAPEQG